MTTELKHPDTKVQELCNLLRKETLDPAKAEAKRIIEDAKAESVRILKSARSEAEELRRENEKELSRQQNIYEASLGLAIKQALSKLRQLVEGIFHDQLKEMLQTKMKEEDVLAKLINVMVTAIEKDGLDAKLAVIIPKEVSVEAINNLLIDRVLRKLEHQSVQLGDMLGGMETKIIDKKIAIDMTDEAVERLLASFVYEDLRKRIFNSGAGR